MDLKGSKTEQNLLSAFAGECMATRKYEMFADIAKDELYIQIRDVFIETANNEKEHAEIWYKYLEGEHGTLHNLKVASGGEFYEATEMYKKFAEVARQEGFVEIAEKFERVASIEAQHEERFNKYVELIEQGEMFKSDEKTNWVCLNCGFLIKDKKEPPKICPACSYPLGYFARECFFPCECDE